MWLLCPSDFCRPPCVFQLGPWGLSGTLSSWTSPQVCKIRMAVSVEYELGSRRSWDSAVHVLVTVVILAPYTISGIQMLLSDLSVLFS